MTTRTQSKRWDLSHVLDLVNSLSSSDHGPCDEQQEKATASTGDVAVHNFGAFPQPAKLGDFGKIWQFLGSPLDAKAPEVPPDLPPRLDYTSDGATYFKSSAKSKKEVAWEDEASVEEPVGDSVTDDSAHSPSTPTLTKTQRKKQRRKERKAQEAAKALRDATVSESEAESIHRRTPARKASAHFTKVPKPTVPAHQPSKVKSSADPAVQEAIARVAEKVAELKNTTPGRQTRSSLAQSTSKPAPVARHNSQPKPAPAMEPTQFTYDALHREPRQEWPVTRSKAPALQMVPSSVQPPNQSTAISITIQPQQTQNQNTPPMRKARFVIEPKTVRSGEDRHWALLLKLLNDFGNDRAHLVSPANLTTHNNDSNGIHVFVDASNIFIGFTDQLKRSRGIPQYAHVPQVDLSFDALALLMERRRPVAKRVLVGSMPHLPAFDKAKAVGYECSILEKVYKARELTDRQIYFQERDRERQPWLRSNAKASAAKTAISANGAWGNGYTSGNGSGSETSTPQYAPARMIEQGVDEILHLKILESVVDSEVPSTVVLATGDAAQAEYSPGFMAMVERALKKGWRVELVSWSKNISGMYKKKEWLDVWGEKFRVVYLDDYAEELLEM